MPSIFRAEHADLARNEKRAIRDLISVHPNEFASDETMFDRLVRMQHFGLPTRLLDVTKNALVALYFATDPGPKDSKTDGVVIGYEIPEEREKYYDSDSVSCLANLANLTECEKTEIYRIRESRDKNILLKEYRGIFNGKDVIQRLHQFIKAEKPYFLPIINPVDLFKPYFVHPKMSNRRIVAQSGAFIIYGINPPQTILFKFRIRETRFVIPERLKQEIRPALENLGFNESTLYPEIDKAAKRIKTRYLVPAK